MIKKLFTSKINNITTYILNWAKLIRFINLDIII